MSTYLLKYSHSTIFKYFNSSPSAHCFFATYPHYQATAGARIDKKPDNNERMRYELAVYEKIREPIRDKSLRIKPFYKYKNRPFISKYSLFRESIELDNIPTHKKIVWLPPILNDTKATQLELDSILQTHYLPPSLNVKLGYKTKLKQYLAMTLNPLLGLYTRSKLYLNSQLMLSSEKAKQYLQDLTIGISTKNGEKLQEITSLNLYPVISRVYHNSNSTTHWHVISHDYQPKLFSLRHLKINKEFTFIQAIYRFSTTQALVKYNSLGNPIIGSVNHKLSVVDYLVFEKLLAYPYKDWKIIDRIGGFTKSLLGFKLDHQENIDHYLR